MTNICKTLLPISLCAIFNLQAMAQNPFLPLWEYIPDAEPYVFEDPDKPGEFRVYIYGSHDSMITEYCGREQVAWSAPINDLNNWRYEGIIFKSETDINGNKLNANGLGDILYAPDIAERVNADGTKTYFFYPNNQAGGRQGMIAKSNRPDGPFVVSNWDKNDISKADGILSFDPAVFIDDDGKVYGYWGFEESNGAELDPNTMATVKPGTKIVHDMISNYKQDGVFRFFEASSMRKIKDKYVFIYSRWTSPGEFGLPESNYTLAYAYSDFPLGPFTYGGTIIDGRARGVDESGKVIATATPTGNTHGSIVEINGQWWVFYHRQTGLDEFARQAMVAPIKVEVEEGRGGKVTISEGEYTSEGFATEGLNPLHKTPAGIACYYTGPTPAYNDYPKFIHSGSYMRPTYFDNKSYEGPYNQKLPFTPVVNNTDGSIVGYKYFNFNTFSETGKANLIFHLIPQGIDGKIEIMIGNPFKNKGGEVVGTLELSKDAPQTLTQMKVNISGLNKTKEKQALYFKFSSDTKEKSLCEIYDFQFFK